MIYADYELFKIKYNQSQKIYSEIMDEYELIFQRTQVKAIEYDKEKIQSNSYHDKIEEYLVEKERKHIDERLHEAKTIMDERAELLALKENELRKSGNLHDRIYTLKYIDGLDVHKIALIINYSESQIYRIIEKIKERCEKMRENLC